jgi:mRNA interferase MazF
VSDVRQGEVYWFDFGSANGSSPAGRHPCVVMQSDSFNSSLIATTVVCLITFNLRRGLAPGNVPLRKGEAHLPKASIVNVSLLLTLNKKELVERIGKLPAATVDRIRGGLELLFDRV